MDITNISISALGAVLSFGLGLFHNKTFVERYKAYRNHVNKEIVESFRKDFDKLKKEKSATKLKDRLDNLFEKIGEETKPIMVFNNVNTFVTISIVLFITAILTSLIAPHFLDPVIGNFTWADLSYIGMIFGVLFFGIAIFRAFRLVCQISDFELSR